MRCIKHMSQHIISYHCISCRIIAYRVVSHEAGETGTDIVDELTKHKQETGEQVKKRKEGGLEGVPLARQLAQKGYKMKKNQRTKGIDMGVERAILSDIQ